MQKKRGKATDRRKKEKYWERSLGPDATDLLTPSGGHGVKDPAGGRTFSHRKKHHAPQSAKQDQEGSADKKKPNQFWETSAGENMRAVKPTHDQEKMAGQSGG